METQHVRYFLAVCDELSFTRAAQKCGIKQPTLSEAIMQMEQAMGGSCSCAHRPSDLSHLVFSCSPSACKSTLCSKTPAQCQPRSRANTSRPSSTISSPDRNGSRDLAADFSFAPEAAVREASGQNLRPHPKRPKPFCRRLTQRRAAAIEVCEAEITGVSGEVVVGRHMGAREPPRWGHPNATSGQLDHLPASVRWSSLAGPSRPRRVWSRRGLNGPQQWSTVRLYDRRGCSQGTAGQRFLIRHASLGWNPQSQQTLEHN
jgi:Bacterial regulatory helix-turn-helix protein, lysR family